MSMLAEKKRKQKWLLNGGTMNRKNDWSKDSNKFGQKMLERMGWKEGKGLGRNEDGLTEHVKVSYKSDNKGIGFKESVEWSVQQDNFKALLEELSNSNDDSNDKPQNVKSLEEKSQNSRARVHYRKFTRGKDLSRYSKKDLANIFGKKKLDCEGSKEDTVEETVESESSVVTVFGGSMVDYFKNKMGFNFSSVKEEEGSEEEHVSFGFGFKSNFNTSEDTDLPLKMKKKNKKLKKNETTFLSYVNEACSEENPVCENDDALKKRKSCVLEEIVSSNKKAKFEEKTKKKKKFKKVNESLELGISNPAFEPLGNNITVHKHVLGTITENEIENESQTPDDKESCKRKKKKSKHLVDVEENQIECSNYVDQQTENRNDNEETIQRKKKKLKGIDNPVLNLSDSNHEIQDSHDTLDNSEAKHKKNKKSKNLEEIESINSNIIAENNHVENGEVKSKKKKKKSKGLDNPTLNLNDSVSVKESKADTTPSDCNNMESFEIKQKKKKKSKGIDNPALKLNDSDSKSSEKGNSGCNDDLESNHVDDFEVKRKKKKKFEGIDNPGLNLDDSNNHTKSASSEKSFQNGTENSALEISDCDIMLNVTDEPAKTVVTPKHKTKTVRFSKTNQEFIIADRSPDDIAKRNELYDINTKVIEDGVKNLKKPNHLGIDNEGFDIRAQQVEESVNMITQTIDHYQAEVENGINESKVKKARMSEEYMVGELNCSDGENEALDEGVKLRYKYAKFNRIEPIWARRNDAQTTLPKKSYKHLIRGDIIIGFKNSNLHEIPGYGMGRCGPRS